MSLFNNEDLLYVIYRFCWLETPQLPFVNRASFRSLGPTKRFNVSRHVRTCKNVTEAMTKAASSGNASLLFDIVSLCGPFTRWDYSMALFYCAGTGSIQIASFLLDKGADINYDFAFPGILREATCNNQVEMVQFLLSRGDIHQIQKNNALIKSAEMGNIEIARILLDNKADPNFMCCRSLSAAANGGHVSIVKMLLENDINVDINNRQALYEATRMGHLSIVLMFLEGNNHRESDRNAALGWAVTHGHLHIVERLLKDGANVQFINEHAIYGASLSGHAEILKCLLEYGASLESQGDKCLIAAASRGYVSTIKILLEKGANVNCQQDEALFLAASRGHELAVATLLQHGANVKNGGNRALPFAAANKSFAILCLLFDAGAEILENYDKPLMDVNYYYRYDIMTTLLQAHHEWSRLNSCLLQEYKSPAQIILASSS